VVYILRFRIILCKTSSSENLDLESRLSPCQYWHSISTGIPCNFAVTFSGCIILVQSIMRIALLPFVIATTVILISLTMTYTCSRPCQFSSTARAGLTRHQSQCAIYRTTQVLRIEQRKARKICKESASNLEQCKERIEVRMSPVYDTPIVSLITATEGVPYCLCT
jgi:hypothetical protein